MRIDVSFISVKAKIHDRSNQCDEGCTVCNAIMRGRELLYVWCSLWVSGSGPGFFVCFLAVSTPEVS